MDSLSISTLIAPFIGNISKFILDWMKKSHYFGFVSSGSSKDRKHLVLFGVVTLLSLVVAFLTGSLNENMIGDILLLLVNVLFGHGVAVTHHELTSK